MLIGTLAHELMHSQDAYKTVAIEVNFDGTGQTESEGFFYHRDSHEWAYLNGWIVFCFLMLITLFSFVVLIIPINKDG